MSLQGNTANAFVKEFNKISAEGSSTGSVDGKDGSVEFRPKVLDGHEAGDATSSAHSALANPYVESNSNGPGKEKALANEVSGLVLVLGAMDALDNEEKNAVFEMMVDEMEDAIPCRGLSLAVARLLEKSVEDERTGELMFVYDKHGITFREGPVTLNLTPPAAAPGLVGQLTGSLVGQLTGSPAAPAPSSGPAYGKKALTYMRTVASVDWHKPLNGFALQGAFVKKTDVVPEGAIVHYCVRPKLPSEEERHYLLKKTAGINTSLKPQGGGPSTIIEGYTLLACRHGDYTSNDGKIVQNIVMPFGDTKDDDIIAKHPTLGRVAFKPMFPIFYGLKELGL